jgi:hypothetical protein
MTFNFIASDQLNMGVFNSVDKFVDTYPDFQTVALNGEHELKLLLELIGIRDFVSHDLKDNEFSKFWDLSKYKFPEFNEEQFDAFYEIWIKTSGRDNNMDEYGSLIFLQGLSAKWNRLNHRGIVMNK